MLCAEWALVKRETNQVTITPLWCKCWHCDECRPRRAARLVWEAKRGKPNIFITLTSRRTKGGDKHAAARKLAWAWRVVRREFLKKNGKRSLPFLVVFEETKKGWPHLHMVARCKWIDHRWLSKRMKKLIGAPHVDVRRIRGTNKVAEYVTKYIGKNPQRFEGTKRYWRSQDYLFPVEDTDEEASATPPEYSIDRQDWLKVVEKWMDGPFILAITMTKAVLSRWEPNERRARGPP